MDQPQTQGLGRPEMLLALVAFLCVGIAGYGWYVAHGGFYTDDWAVNGTYRLQGFWSSVSVAQRVTGGRPLLALLLPVPELLFGTRAQLQIAMDLVIGVVTSGALYALLRTVGVSRLAATAIGVLALLYPWSDSVRLRADMSVVGLCVPLLLVGAIVAIRALRHSGPGGAVRHACAIALYVASVLTYEATAAAAMLAGLLYIGRAPARTVRSRWAADVVAVLCTLVYSLESTVGTRTVRGIGARIADVGPFARQTLGLLATSIVPLNAVTGAVKVAVLVATALTIALGVARLRRNGDAVLREPLLLAAAGAVVIAAAYLMYLASDLHPLDPGIENRLNVLAGIGLAALAYAVVAIACRLVVRSGPAARLALPAAALALAVGYGIRVGQDESSWARASRLQHVVLASIRRSVWPLPRRSTLLTFGFASQVSNQIPVFYKPWDLKGALEWAGDDPTISAYPVYLGVRLRCGSDSVTLHGPGDYGTVTVRYGRLIFLDVPTGVHLTVTSAGACRTGLGRFRPGPAVLTS